MSTKNKAKEVFDLLRNQLIPLFQQYKLPILSIFYSPVLIEKWAARIIRRKIKCFDKERFNFPRELGSELYWSYTDLQLVIQHMLWIKNCGGLTKGIDEKQFNKIDLPKGQVIDFIFWHYVGYSWESLYRTWNRLANLINFFIFDVMDYKKARKDKIPLYFNRIIERIEKECVVLAKSKPYIALKKKSKEYNKIANKRNTISHHKSSIFSRFKINIDAYPIYQPSGLPSFVAQVEFSDPSREVSEILRLYRNIKIVSELTFDLINTHLPEKPKSVIVKPIKTIFVPKYYIQ